MIQCLSMYIYIWIYYIHSYFKCIIYWLLWSRCFSLQLQLLSKYDIRLSRTYQCTNTYTYTHINLYFHIQLFIILINIIFFAAAAETVAILSKNDIRLFRNHQYIYTHMNSNLYTFILIYTVINQYNQNHFHFICSLNCRYLI